MIRRFLVPVAVLALLVLLGVGLLRPRDGADPIVGQTAPDFKLKNLDGGTLTLSQFKGRPVVINFFASWCLPCRDEAPLLRQAALDYARQNLLILGVAYSDKEPDTRKFRDEFQLGFPVLMDDDESRAAISYGLAGVPETYFVSKDGRILSRHKGAIEARDLEAGLKAILE